jgi:hypothetical protein
MASIKVPENFNVHPRINKFHFQERASLLKNKVIDWATAESLATMSLLKEGYLLKFVKIYGSSYLLFLINFFFEEILNLIKYY